MEKHASVVEQHRPALRFVAETFGSKGVAELERLSTAYLVTRQAGADHSTEDRAQRLRKLKPHISVDDALVAMKDIDNVIARAKGAELTQ